MGWLHNSDWSKQDVINRIVKNYSLIDYSVRNNVLYGVCPYNADKVIAVDGVNKVIIVAILDHHNGWGYKVMTEEVVPCYYDCPNRILKQSTIEDDTWRKLCHKQTERKFIIGEVYTFKTELGGFIEFMYKSYKNGKRTIHYWQSVIDSNVKYKIKKSDLDYYV